MPSSAPYTSLAPHYDAVMAHVDYPGWARHLRKLWRTTRNKPPRRILELAAGTCRLARPPVGPLWRNAFSVHTDLSFDMLRTAQPDHGSVDETLRRAACDATALPFHDGGENDGGFDLVLMVYDSLNYLTRPDDVRRLMDEVLRVLKPGGIFLFDVTTATCSRRYFADALDYMETEHGAVVRASRYDAETRTQLNLFTFFTEGPDGRFDRREEVHRQRIWPAAFLGKTAHEAGFSVQARLADFTLEPGTDRNERLHFVLQKSEARRTSRTAGSRGPRTP